MDSHDLTGRPTVITGASRGLGAALARAVARAGAPVALLATSPDDLEEVTSEIRADGGEAEGWEVDVADWPAVESFSREVVARFGDVHGVVNNAGVLGGRVPLAEYSPGEWERVIRVNVDGSFHVLRAFLPVLRESGGGSVIGVSSGVAAEPRAEWGAYAVSKWATDGLTLNVAEEEVDHGIRANVVDPGSMRTRMRRNAYPDEDPETLPEPSEVTEVFLWLLSEASAGVTGQRFRAQEWSSPEEGR